MSTHGSLVLACLALGACSQAELTPATTVPLEGGCPTAPIAFCDAAAPPECFGDPDSAVPAVRRISADSGYPLNCTVQLLDPAPSESGLCENTTACSCLATIVDAGLSVPAWSCGR